MIMKKFYLPVLAYTFALIPGFIWADSSILELSDKMDRYAVNHVTTFLEDKTGTLDISDIILPELSDQFLPRETNNFGYNDAVFWARLNVHNPESENLDWRLELDYSVFDLVSIYNSKGVLLYTGGDGIEFHKRPVFFRNVVFPLTTNSLGHQTFYLKLKSESSKTIPLFAYTVVEFNRRVANEQLMFGLYYGTMLVMLIYNAFLFFSTKDFSYFYYVAYIGGYIIFQSTINGLAFQYLWPDHPTLANYSLPFSMFYTVGAGAIFTRSFLNAKVRTPKVYKLYYVLLAYCIAGMFLTFVLEYYIIIKIAIFICFPVVLLIYLNGFQCYRLGQRSAFYFLIAWTVFLLGVILYSSKAFGLLPSNFLTTWAIQIGSASEVVLLSLALANKINEMSLNQKHGVEDLRSAHIKIQESENKFKNLFEASEELIFTLDDKLRFTSANKALNEILKFPVKDIIGTSFIDLLYHDEPENFNTILVKEKLDEMHNLLQSVQFQAAFRQRRMKEPRELWVRLQFIETENKDNNNKEILGRASQLGEDLVFRDFHSERLVIYTKNFIGNVDIFSHRLTSNIHKYTDTITVSSIKLCIREVLINAIEHGNLNVTFDEKTDAMERGEYFEFLQERQRDPRYKDKRIRLDYALNSKRFGLRVTDEGSGFDHKKRMSMSMAQLNEDNIGHGRGIFLLIETFDRIKYNDVGNQVTLIKRFN